MRTRLRAKLQKKTFMIQHYKNFRIHTASLQSNAHGESVHAGMDTSKLHM
jgi:hypothetical protein